eukprot:gb/GEZN01002323.1/.p1 GENE.gb/GEZN01002323.1/~~gb/GEZN01002323.1/.p1  ORF type:complete len:678 (-),score=112.30 gb/GEZN01002323.1/:436-2469(-)
MSKWTKDEFIVRLNSGAPENWTRDELDDWMVATCAPKKVERKVEEDKNQQKPNYCAMDPFTEAPIHSIELCATCAEHSLIRQKMDGCLGKVWACQTCSCDCLKHQQKDHVGMEEQQLVGRPLTGIPEQEQVEHHEPELPMVETGMQHGGGGGGGGVGPDGQRELSPEEQFALQQQAYAAAAAAAQMGQMGPMFMHPQMMQQMQAAQMMPGGFQSYLPMMFPHMMGMAPPRKRQKVASDTCAEKGCTETPVYSSPRSRVPRFCKNHKRSGMKDVAPKDCFYEGCNRNALWNFPEADSTKFCGHHKEKGMIDLTRATRKTCIHPGCSTQPSFNSPGTITRRFCAMHKTPDMVLVGKSRSCEGPECSTRPSYNKPGEKSPRYCAKHKQEGMVDVKTMSCAGPECTTRPSYNWAGARTGKFCAAHRLPNMVDVRTRTCLNPSCSTFPNYNFPGLKTPRYCSAHKSEGMVNVKAKECLHPGCKTIPSFTQPNSRQPQYCASHRLPGMVNVQKLPPQTSLDRFADAALEQEDEPEGGELKGDAPSQGDAGKAGGKTRPPVRPKRVKKPSSPVAAEPEPNTQVATAAQAAAAAGQQQQMAGGANYNPMMSAAMMAYGLYNPMMFMDYTQMAAMQQMTGEAGDGGDKEGGKDKGKEKEGEEEGEGAPAEENKEKEGDKVVEATAE